MFDWFNTMKYFKNDAAKVVIPDVSFDYMKIENKSTHVRSVFRFAACIAVAIALVLTGTVWLPDRHVQPVKGGGKIAAVLAKSSTVQKVSHDFTLQVYAADASNITTSSHSDDSKKKGVTLKANLVVPVLSGKLEYMEKSGKIEKLIEYGKVGRPQHKYRRN